MLGESLFERWPTLGPSAVQMFRILAETGVSVEIAEYCGLWALSRSRGGGPRSLFGVSLSGPSRAKWHSLSHV